MKLEKIKDNMNQKLKEMEKVERKKEVIKQTLSSLYKELDFTIEDPKEFERPDMSNLDTALIITNKDYYGNKTKAEICEIYGVNSITELNYDSFEEFQEDYYIPQNASGEFKEETQTIKYYYKEFFVILFKNDF